jgi:hypothetical protein
VYSGRDVACCSSSSSDSETSDSPNANGVSPSSSSSWSSSADAASDSGLFEIGECGLAITRGEGVGLDASKDRRVGRSGVDLDRRPAGSGSPLL